MLETSDSSYLHDVASVDIHSAAFASLPPEVQHEMLQERQQLERHSYTDPALLPAVRTSVCVCVCVYIYNSIKYNYNIFNKFFFAVSP